MAKRNVVTITLPHNVTVKADKLTDRTIRTVKVGDYLQSSLDVRGTLCTFYGVVTEVVGGCGPGSVRKRGQALLYLSRQGCKGGCLPAHLSNPR